MKIKLRKQLQDILKLKWRKGKGKSKHDIKDEHNSTPYIHSQKTYNTYKQQINHFVDWCYSKGEKYIDVDDYIKDLASEYLQEKISEGKSAWTIQTIACALAKVLDCPTAEFSVNLPQRKRGAIKRSRLVASNDEHVNLAKYADVVLFQKCFGLRRQEIEYLQMENVHITEKDIWVKILNGKGGKQRNVKAYGSPEELTMLKKYLRYREDKVFAHIPKAIDLHSYRAEYACRVYKAHMRQISNLSKSDKYICRKDKKGQIYDRQALRIVSQALGHNRECVVVDNYLYRL